MAASAAALSADWQDEFLRLRDVQGRIDQRRAEWAQEEPKYQAGRLLPSYSMDRKYDIFMEPRVPAIAQKAMTPPQAEEDALVLEDPEEILAQVENAVRSTDDLRATAGSEKRKTRKLLDPDHKRKKRGFFGKVFGGSRKG